MQNEKEYESFLRKMVFPILAMVYAAQVYACRGIFADGSHNLFVILIDQGFNLSDTRRIVSHILVQAPTVLLVKLGVTNLVFLRYFFSAWLLLCPLLVWSLALAKLRDDILFWPFVMVFCFAYFNTDFFAIGEFGLCFALAAYCLAFLLRPLPPSRVQRAVLLAAAALLSFNYPSALFHGSLLLALTLAKPREEWNGAPQFYKYTLAFLFAVSAATSLWSVLWPSDPANFSEARNPVFAIQDMQFRCVFFYAVAVSLLYFMAEAWMWIAVILCCTILLVIVSRDDVRLGAYTHYMLRAYVALGLTVCGVGLWWFDRSVRRRIAAVREWAFLLPAVLATILLATLSWYDVELSLDYANYLNIFRQTVDSKTGIIPYENSGLSAIEYTRRFSWGWTYPLMSVLLRDNSRQAIILNPAPYHGYEPFNPRDPLPDFDRYYR